MSPSSTPCTGCGACSATCSVSAIRVAENADGFLSPVIDNDKCVECGICQSVCYRFQSVTDLSRIDNTVCYATCSNDNNTHKSTTSGGFAYELSKWGIENGYKIVGVVYDYDTDKARTIIVDNLTDLEAFKGSKYIQSYTEEAFHNLCKLAKSNANERFICIGTPCQIFGLRKLVEKKQLHNDIIYVDLFCHGVPSYLVWEPYIKEHRLKLGHLDNVNFRYKGNGWHQYSIKITGDRGSYSDFAYNDVFYRYFFDNVALNASCFTCMFRKNLTAADIRIGDFLGSAYEYREDGISAIVTTSSKGVRIVEQLENSGKISVVGKHAAAECLKSQSTEDYNNIELRNSVIERLRKEDIHITQKWYVSRFSLKRRIYLRLKSMTTLLPYKMIIALRRLIRIVR